MASCTKNTEEVFRWITAIAREFQFPFPIPSEERHALMLRIYPELIRTCVNPIFSQSMADYIQHEKESAIRFRYDEYYAFKKNCKKHLAQLFLKAQSFPQYPPGSFLLMRRTIKDLKIEKQPDGIYLNISTDYDRYPISMRFYTKQLFLLEDFLKKNFLPSSILKHPKRLAQSLNDTSFYYLKYAHNYDTERNRVLYWTLNYLATNPEDIWTHFQNNIQNGYLRSFKPNCIPSHTLPPLEHHTEIQLMKKRGKTGTLYVYSYLGCGAVVFKDTLIAYITQQQLHWIGKPQPELLTSLHKLIGRSAA